MSGADHVEDPIKIVYVEDDERLARLTAQYLRGEGLEVFHVARGDRATAEVIAVRPDVVVLDLSLPRKDGLEVCSEIRRHVAVPVIMVTARTEEADRVLGLEGGADDYMTKPFSPRELLARIRAQARRARGKAGPRTTRVVVGALVLDSGNLTASYEGKPLALTPHELAVLRALAEHPGSVLSREQLLQLSTGTTAEAFDRSIDVHIVRLRQKLGDDPRAPTLIKTIRGRGYALMEQKA